MNIQKFLNINAMVIIVTVQRTIDVILLQIKQLMLRQQDIVFMMNKIANALTQ